MQNVYQGRLLADAVDDEISGIREADIGELEQMSRSLMELTGKWQDWGMFRHLTTDNAVRHLKNNCIQL